MTTPHAINSSPSVGLRAPSTPRRGPARRVSLSPVGDCSGCLPLVALAVFSFLLLSLWEKNGSSAVIVTSSTRDPPSRDQLLRVYFASRLSFDANVLLPGGARIPRPTTALFCLPFRSLYLRRRERENKESVARARALRPFYRERPRMSKAACLYIRAYVNQDTPLRGTAQARIPY